MDSAVENLCPGCGQPLQALPTALEFACDHCGEALVLSPDRRVFLAHPVESYLIPPETLQNPDTEAVPTFPAERPVTQKQVQRKLHSVAMAFERSATRKIQARHLLAGGAGLAGAGIILASVAVARLLLGIGWWTDLGLAALALAFLIPAGIYLIISGTTITGLLNKEEEALGQERDALVQETEI